MGDKEASVTNKQFRFWIEVRKLKRLSVKFLTPISKFLIQLSNIKNKAFFGEKADLKTM